MKKHLLLFLAVLTMSSLMTVFVISCDNDNNGGNSTFIIRSPYESVNWNTFGQYKAALHAHTINSDGAATMEEAVNEHYRLGYDILAITDHVWKGENPRIYLDLMTTSWTATEWPGEGGGMVELSHITQAQLDAIQAGTHTVPNSVDRGGRGMMMIPDTGEMAFENGEEINSFFYDQPAPKAWSSNFTAGIRTATQHSYAVHFINHPSRTTNGQNFHLVINDGDKPWDDPLNPSNQNTWIRYFANLYMEFPANRLVGMEIFNRRDTESRQDRILWDNVLARTVPEGRFVWGYGNDDSHSVNGIGINYNVMLLPSKTLENFRNAMINGHSYAVASAAHNEHAQYGPLSRPADTHKSGHLNDTFPIINSVTVNHSAESITIAAENANKIVWISDGGRIIWIDGESNDNTVTYITSTLTLTNDGIIEDVGSYVRANIVGHNSNGMAVIQPIGTRRR